MKKMFYFNYALILLLPLVSFSQETYQSKNTKIDNNGLLINKSSNNPITGKVYSKTDKGDASYEYKNGKKDGFQM